MYLPLAATFLLGGRFRYTRSAPPDTRLGPCTAAASPCDRPNPASGPSGCRQGCKWRQGCRAAGSGVQRRHGGHTLGHREERVGSPAAAALADPNRPAGAPAGSAGGRRTTAGSIVSRLGGAQNPMAIPSSRRACWPLQHRRSLAEAAPTCSTCKLAHALPTRLPHPWAPDVRCLQAAAASGRSPPPRPHTHTHPWAPPPALAPPQQPIAEAQAQRQRLRKRPLAQLAAAPTEACAPLALHGGERDPPAVLARA